MVGLLPTSSVALVRTFEFLRRVAMPPVIYVDVDDTQVDGVYEFVFRCEGR